MGWDVPEDVEYFNSQPHEEADLTHQQVSALHHYFNSQPHEEADKVYGDARVYGDAFQLTASRRG